MACNHSSTDNSILGHGQNLITLTRFSRSHEVLERRKITLSPIEKDGF